MQKLRINLRTAHGVLVRKTKIPRAAELPPEVLIDGERAFRRDARDESFTGEVTWNYREATVYRIPTDTDELDVDAGGAS